MASVDIKIMDLWTFNIQILSGAIIHFSSFLELSVGHFCCTYKDLRCILDFEDIWRIFWDVFVVGLFGRFKRCCRSTFWGEKGDLNQVMTWAWPGFTRLRPTWPASQIPRHLGDVLMALGAFFVHEWLPFPSMAVFLDESAWAEKRFDLSIRRHFRDMNGQNISSCFLCTSLRRWRTSLTGPNTGQHTSESQPNLREFFEIGET